ncbi:hypothetical protein EJ04DRAFT_517213 [Polyplosphaeria fusca]|uniref:Prion-inhibition and propagation HeLo domain-containing protein n=1 Tax=Polyplosphaeria fusca TaxID=682080 RepID=A0A9P4QJB2_9PLEO|nr:hypothetical protein EJ04DRAFT_517213 [Polyplosphaeria fusca]
MGEAAGLAISAVALAGLFNNTVDCFEYVQLGRGFGKSFQTSQLKLDNGRLRLSRWGHSLGLGSSMQDEQSLEQRLGSGEDVKQAGNLLGQIQDLFADAEGLAEKYKRRTRPDDSSLALCNPQADLDPLYANLHDKMRQLSIDRQNRTAVRQKVKWALYEEKSFRRLIEDVIGRVNDLVELFPASQAMQKQLCETEVSVIGNGAGTAVLREVVAEQDKALAEALAKAVNATNGPQTANFTGSNNSGFQLGFNSGSISGFNFCGGKSGSTGAHNDAVE